MVKKKLKIIWDLKAKDSLKEIYLNIKKESPNSAKKTINTIRETIRSAAVHPEIFQIDRFKTNNDGTYRAFEKFSYRIVYKFTKTQIIILRISNSAQEPVEY